MTVAMETHTLRNIQYKVYIIYVLLNNMLFNISINKCTFMPNTING